MKHGTVNKSTIVNIFQIFLHTLHRSFTRLTIITRKTTIKIENLKLWGEWSGKEPIGND